MVWAIITNILYPGWVNHKQLFLTVLKIRKSKIKVLTELISSEDLLLSLQIAIFSLYIEKKVEKEALMFLLRRVQIPLKRVQPS